MTVPWQHPDAWWTVTAPITGGSLQRSRPVLERVLDQFDVENADRYKRDAAGRTKCSTLVNDATRALAAEVPIRELMMVQRDLELAARLKLLNCPDPVALADIITEAEKTVPRIVELDAGAMTRWLVMQGPRHGWMETDQAIARTNADAGCPVVAASENPGGEGHMVMGTPAPVGTPSDGMLWCCASGAHNFRRCLVRQTFGALPVRYFVHP